MVSKVTISEPLRTMAMALLTSTFDKFHHVNILGLQDKKTSNLKMWNIAGRSEEMRRLVRSFLSTLWSLHHRSLPFLISWVKNTDVFHSALPATNSLSQRFILSEMYVVLFPSFITRWGLGQVKQYLIFGFRYGIDHLNLD